MLANSITILGRALSNCATPNSKFLQGFSDWTNNEFREFVVGIKQKRISLKSLKNALSVWIFECHQQRFSQRDLKILKSLWAEILATLQREIFQLSREETQEQLMLFLPEMSWVVKTYLN